MHEHSPQYTFGLKTQLDKPNPNPAPNVYNIPTVMGAAKEGHFRAAPSFSISGRTKEFPDGRLLNPGPGAYNDVSADSIKPKSPAFTVSARYTMPGDHSPKPGPGAYSPEKVCSATPRIRIIVPAPTPTQYRNIIPNQNNIFKLDRTTYAINILNRIVLFQNNIVK